MRKIYLAGKRGQGLSALVSDEDFDYLNQWTWCIIPKGYAIRTDRTGGRKKTVYMHLVIYLRSHTNEQPRQVDHKDGNKLNNLRSNLRAATNQLNQANVGRQKNNTSGFKGVSWHKQHHKYQVRICVSRKRIHLGFFHDPQDAHQAYCQAAVQYFGEFARF